MPNKKLLPKLPTPIALTPHEGERSPHLLDLRAIQPAEVHLDQPPSLEEKIAAFDEQLKEVPNLLKNGVDNAARLLEDQREAWEHGFSAFMNRALLWGSTVRTQLKTTRRPWRRKVKPALLLNLPTSYFARLPALPLLVLLLIITLPIQGLLLYRSIDGIRTTLLHNWQGVVAHGTQFARALHSKNLTTATAELTTLTGHLKTIRQRVAIAPILRTFLPDQLALRIATVEIAEAGTLALSTILQELGELQRGQRNPDALIRSIQTELAALEARLRPLLEHASFTPALTPLYTIVRHTQDVANLVGWAGGVDGQTRRLLLVFQNPRELRATGGFLGSLAILTFKDGRLIASEVPEGGSYDTQGQLTLQRISPRPLHLINPRFELQDANWWPDFPTSAKKITELYEAAGGSTLDGVVAITAHLGEELLDLSGPITTEDGTQLTADNFVDTLQTAITRDREVNRHAPKKIIAALFPRFAQVFTTMLKEQPTQLARLLQNAAMQKDLQLWSRSESIQGAISRLGVSGALPVRVGDALMVISANVGGGKTDGVIQENIVHEARLTRDLAHVNVAITRTHGGKRGDRQTGLRNISYLRIYVPAGAKLVAAEGFTPPPSASFEAPDPTLTPDYEVRAQESSTTLDANSGTAIWHEQDYTVFGNWITVDPGDSSTARLSYTLPLTLEGRAIPYSLTLEPQAGKHASLTSRILLDETVRLLNTEDQNGWNNTGWTFTGPLDHKLVASGILYRL